jgi:uncharacterized membrane protein
MFHPRDLLDWVFEIGIVLKRLNDLLELVGGVLRLTASPGAIKGIVRTPTGAGLIFGAVYLLIHGGVNVTLVIALLRNKLWAYPWLIAVLMAFIAYQIYLIALRPISGLAALTVFDVLVVGLTWREYRKQRGIGSADD